MRDLLSYAPREMVEWIALVIGVGAAAVFIVLESLRPPEPEQPWRWGDPQRRDTRGVSGLTGHAAGFVLVCVIVAIVRIALR